MHVETRYFFIFQNISGTTIFCKNLWLPFFKLYHTLFIKKKIRNIATSVWTGTHQKLDFFVRKTWLPVTVNIPAKKLRHKANFGFNTSN